MSTITFAIFLIMPTQQAKTTYLTLDGIRGVAAMMVVLRHTPGLFGITTGDQESYLAVDIFFVLSGAVISNAYELRLNSGLTVMQFIWIRIIRLYPLYFLGCAIGICALALNDLGMHRFRHMFERIAPALMVLPYPLDRAYASSSIFPLNIPAWSLFLELAVNVVYASLLKYLSNRLIVSIMLGSAIGLVISLSLFSAGADLNLGWNRSSFLGGVFRVGYSFFAGVFLMRAFSARTKRIRESKADCYLPWIILVLVTLILASSPQGELKPWFDFLCVVVLFPLLVYCSLHFQPYGWSARIFTFIGGISYAIYAVHYPLLQLTELLMGRRGLVPTHYAPWIGLLFFASLVTLCWALDKFYDSPLRRSLQKKLASPSASRTLVAGPVSSNLRSKLADRVLMMISYRRNELLIGIWSVGAMVDLFMFTR